MRFFAVAKGWEHKGINLPQRSTENAAGYDFESGEDIIIPSIWKLMFKNLSKGENAFKPVIVQTGVKAYMEADEVLYLYPRSSNAIKRFLTMPNSVGIIDADYFENEDNDGAIGVPLWNFGLKDEPIQKGERIAQGVFQKFLTTKDDHQQSKSTRVGGFGSTGTKLNNLGGDQYDSTATI